MIFSEKSATFRDPAVNKNECGGKMSDGDGVDGARAGITLD
jgi:hypothetical protein